MQLESSIDGRLFYLIWMEGRSYDVKLLGVGMFEHGGRLGLLVFGLVLMLELSGVSFSSLVVVVPSTSGERACHNWRNDMDLMVCYHQ